MAENPVIEALITLAMFRESVQEIRPDEGRRIMHAQTRDIAQIHRQLKQKEAKRKEFQTSGSKHHNRNHSLPDLFNNPEHIQMVLASSVPDSGYQESSWSNSGRGGLGDDEEIVSPHSFIQRKKLDRLQSEPSPRKFKTPPPINLSDSFPKFQNSKPNILDQVNYYDVEATDQEDSVSKEGEWTSMEGWDNQSDENFFRNDDTLIDKPFFASDSNSSIPKVADEEGKKPKKKFPSLKLDTGGDEEEESNQLSEGRTPNDTEMEGPPTTVNTIATVTTSPDDDETELMLLKEVVGLESPAERRGSDAASCSCFCMSIRKPRSSGRKAANLKDVDSGGRSNSTSIPVVHEISLKSVGITPGEIVHEPLKDPDPGDTPGVKPKRRSTADSTPDKFIPTHRDKTPSVLAKNKDQIPVSSRNGSKNLSSEEWFQLETEESSVERSHFGHEEGSQDGNSEFEEVHTPITNLEGPPEINSPFVSPANSPNPSSPGWTNKASTRHLEGFISVENIDALVIENSDSLSAGPTPQRHHQLPSLNLSSLTTSAPSYDPPGLLGGSLDSYPPSNLLPIPPISYEEATEHQNRMLKRGVTADRVLKRMATTESVRRISTRDDPIEDYENNPTSLRIEHLVSMSGFMGRGATGVVVRALHMPMCKLYALKQTNFRQRELLHAEMAIQARIKRTIPHIDQLLRFHECFILDDTGELVIVMDLMDLGSCYDFMNPENLGRTFSLDQVRHIAHQSVLGLQALHNATNPICHRDIKPHNILLSSDGSVKIADYGLCTELSHRSDQLNDPSGTKKYFSPERHERHYGLKSDIWSLGITIFELATNELIPDEQLSAWKVQEGQIPVLSRFEHNELLCDFVNCCLKTNLDERWDATMLVDHPFINVDINVIPTFNNDSEVSHQDLSEIVDLLCTWCTHCKKFDIPPFPNPALHEERANSLSRWTGTSKKYIEKQVREWGSEAMNSKVRHFV